MACPRCLQIGLIAKKSGGKPPFLTFDSASDFLGLLFRMRAAQLSDWGQLSGGATFYVGPTCRALTPETVRSDPLLGARSEHQCTHQVSE